MDDQPAARRMLRLAGVVIVGVWLALALAVAVAYRPGGQLDALVAVVAVLPVLVAAVAVAWPAVTRSHRDRIGLAWIWIFALLLTIPLIYSVATALTSAGSQRLVPSAEIAYGAVLALGVTAVFSLLGLVHRRAREVVFERRASLLTLSLAAGATAAIAVVFGGVLVLNERTLRLEIPAASRYGPTDPVVIPPECKVAPLLGPHGRVAMTARLLIDDRVAAESRLEGRRDGRDEVWAGRWSGAPTSAAGSGEGEPDGRLAYRRVGSQAWLNEIDGDPDAPGTRWREVEPDPFGLVDPTMLTMDGPPRTVLGGLLGPLVTEDMGLEVVEGARSRHCRTFVDGPTSLASFLPLRWLVSGTATSLPTELPAWRGELDWWVFGDGELGRAAIEVSGLPSDAWARLTAIEGTLQAELDVTDRTRSADVTRPLGAATDAGPDATDDALESAAP